MAAVPNLSYEDLVLDRSDTFQVHTDVYVDREVFEAEIRNIFERIWVYIAHESEIPDIGDYKTSSIGRQPIIVTRHEDGEVYVLLNRCRHRGAVVCREALGHSNYFRCPYHNWSYANDGTLVGMAQSSGYPDDFDKSGWGLARAPRVASYRGLVFASLSPTGPSLDEHLAPVRPYIDWWFNRSPVGTVTVLPTAYPAHEIEEISKRRNIFVFPNVYLFDTQIRVISPLAVDRTEVSLYVYGLDGVPDGLNEGRYRAHERFYGPSGFGSPDDVEIFVVNQTGLQARGVDWLLLSRGQHREQRLDNGEVVGHSTDEVPVRAMYQEWKRLMSA